MKFYTLYFRNYIFLFITFIFAVLLISIFPLYTEAEASGSLYGMADIPVGKSTKEPMKQFTVSTDMPKPAKSDSSQDSNKDNKTQGIKLKTLPPNNDKNNLSKKSHKKSTTNTVQPSEQPKTRSKKNILKTLTPSNPPKMIMTPKATETAYPVHIYLSDNFLHLGVGETYAIGISFISQNDAVENKNNKSFNLFDEIDINIICLDSEIKKISSSEIKNSDPSKVENDNNTKNNKILSVNKNIIKIDKEGIVVLLVYAKNNPDIKASCTIRAAK